MEVLGRKDIKGKVWSSELLPSYPTRLQLYTLPPTHDISLDEFNEVASIRQRVLQDVSNLQEKLKRGDLSNDDYSHQMREKVKLLPLTTPSESKGTEEKHIDERRRDHVSHYILRLAYCESEDLRRWLLSQEVALLHYRLSEAKMVEIHDLIDRYIDLFPFKKVNDSQLDKHLSSLISSFYNTQGTEYYQVRFTEVLDLVQKRSVIVYKGYAYLYGLPMIKALICNRFRSLLSQDLVRTVAFMSVIKEDERVGRTIKNLRTRYLGEDFSNTGSDVTGTIRCRDLDTLSKESFPPCMRHLHETIRKEHHLRHFGRLQYGLFLKSIDLSLDQALMFWREEFTKKMEQDKFDKQYAYNIRHSYGKEGKRTSYTPYSCMKIILSNAPASGDHHGCPFKHWDHSNLQRMLTSYGVPMSAHRLIQDYAHDSHYQLACQKYFDVTHHLQQSTFSLEHPTQYFIQSRRVRGGGEVGGVKTEDDNEDTMELSAQELSKLFDDDMTDAL